MKKMKVVVVGCGDRACVYANEGVNTLKCMEVVAAVDPNPERLKYMQKNLGVAEGACYFNMEDVLKQGKIADCVINGTMDDLHLSTAIPFLKQGYDMLLEKPLTNNAADLLYLKKTADENGCQLMTCHVLRYAPFYYRIKELINDGIIGEIVNIDTSERVGATHSSYSYVRGKWKSEKECGSSLLLAKCCHDTDMLCWLNNATEPEEVSSYAERRHFIPERAPKGAGTRCLVDCPEEIRKNCIYDVQSMYLDNCIMPWYPWQCTGKNYEDVTEEEKVESLKTYNPHGVCIYKAGGDIVDRQVLAVRFKNGSVATHTVVLGAMKPGRSIWITGTKGEIEGNAEDGTLYLRKYSKENSLFQEEKLEFMDRKGETGGHFGGDKALVHDFCNLLQGGEKSISCTSIEDSINGHLLVYAADKSAQSKAAVQIAAMLTEN